ncbi:MAG: FtsQ-type POTRA domain-containing protein [Candidatus Eisenbacteria sp.]|nr:FtsQ-type POTRA domain-containing protein [Candidatus Eisenbacteria bacterium]
MSGLSLKNKSRRGKSARARTAARKGARGRLRRTRNLTFRLPRVEWSVRRFAIVASALVLVAGMTLVISRAPGWGRGEERFLLSRFEVRGNRVLTEDEVLELSGVVMGSNLLDLRISLLEEAVAASPRVDRARARRVLPDRVVVTLDEKRPAALVAVGANVVLEVTDDGAVLPAAAWTASVDLPVITGAVGEVEPGITELSRELTDALALLRRAREVSEGLWMDISEVRIAPGSGLVIYTVADGAEIRFGSGALGSRDLERLWRVLTDIRDRGREAETVDLRFKNQVVVRLS